MTEEKPKEKTEEELREEYAKIYLDKKNRLWDYAAPKLVTHSEYGNLANGSEAFYANAIQKVPTEDTYKVLFLPQLLTDGGSVNGQYLQSTSLRILQESFFGLKIEDALKYAGYKGSVKADYAGKYMTQIDKKEAGVIVGTALQYQTDEVVKGILDLRQKEIPKGLEKIVGEPETEEGKK